MTDQNIRGAAPAATHYGHGTAGELTRHLGTRTDCPAPDCRDTDRDEPQHDAHPARVDAGMLDIIRKHDTNAVAASWAGTRDLTGTELERRMLLCHIAYLETQVRMFAEFDRSEQYVWEAVDEDRIGLYATQDLAEDAAKRRWREANLEPGDNDDETAFDWWGLDEDGTANELAVDSHPTDLVVRRVEVRQAVA